jgi:hypothetical protein
MVHKSSVYGLSSSMKALVGKPIWAYHVAIDLTNGVLRCKRFEH